MDAHPNASAFRTERDPLGEVAVPIDALWGAQTQRAVENFPISGLRPSEAFVVAVVWIKRAAAAAHRDTGRLDARLADAIVAAADEVLAGRWREHFVVDPFQAGAGTSHHMNVNEVLANRANELLGAARGANVPVHPNDHVNMGQSTNDVIPTAIRIAVLARLAPLDASLRGLGDALRAQAVACDDVVKAGRTHLQDAMPIRLGQVFAAWAAAIDRAVARLHREAEELRDLPLGGSAVGTGVNVEPEWIPRVIAELARVSGLALREGDRILGMQSQGDAAAFSGALRVVAIELSRIASDLRLLAMGPRTGIDEVRLPEVQPGSSIMPGKVNPSVPEMVNQVCLHVTGLDAAVAAAAAQGQLELNVMMPVIAHDLLDAMRLLGNAATVLAERCIAGLQPNVVSCAYWVERSAALATALAPRLGFARAAEVAKRAVREDVSIRDLVRRERLLPDDEIDAVLDLRRMTEPGVPGE